MNLKEIIKDDYCRKSEKCELKKNHTGKCKTQFEVLGGMILMLVVYFLTLSAIFWTFDLIRSLIK